MRARSPIRGSGLRNNFHARGVNLLVNGMPYRNADGFTDFESLELLTTESIEVYKGGNALRYGGSTMGGAINLETRTGYSAPTVGVTTEGGSFGFFKTQLASGGTTGKLDWYGSAARTTLDGYRDWAQQGRTRLNGHVGYVLSPADGPARVLLLRPRDRAASRRPHGRGARHHPTAADPGNVADHWGRNYDLHHLGVQLRSQLGDHQRLAISPYAQFRTIDHPIFQVISQDSRDWGAEVRYENSAALSGRTNRLTLGFQPAWLDMDNRQYENLAGSHGELRKESEGQGRRARLLWRERARGDAASDGRARRACRSRHPEEPRFLSRRRRPDRSPGLRRRAPEARTAVCAAHGRRAGLRQREPILRAASAPRAQRPERPGVHRHCAPQNAWQMELGVRGGARGVRWDVAAYDVELEDEILNLNVPPFAGAPSPCRRTGTRPALGTTGSRAAWRWTCPLRASRAWRTPSRATDSWRTPPSRATTFRAPRGITSRRRSACSIGRGSRSRRPSSGCRARMRSTARTRARNDGWATVGLRAEYTIARAGVTAFAAAART